METRHPSSRSLIEGLRRRVREMERHAPLVAPSAEESRASWTLGAPEIDACLGNEGLDIAGVHEVKPAAEGPAAAMAAAAQAFALRLAVRRGARRLNRRHTQDHDQAHDPGGPLPRILWCATAAAGHERGRLYGPGLISLGLDPRSLILVETARASDTLWAIEEGLRSNAASLVIGLLDAVGLTPARRLSLAAEQNRTPCLLLTSAQGASAGSTATRWRINPMTSGAHPFDARAPGASRLSVTLERCRRTPFATGASFALEWSDETYGFRLAADVAYRAPETAQARRRAG